MNEQTKAELYEEIYIRNQEGESPAALAAEYRLSPRTIHNIIKEDGVYAGKDKDTTIKSSFKAPKPWDEIRPGFSKPNRTIYASG